MHMPDCWYKETALSGSFLPCCKVDPLRTVDGLCPAFPPNSLAILLYVVPVPKEPHFYNLEFEYSNQI